ncbi:MAG: LysR family transcriptional regulator, partial [Burkholderia sp.]|nr:LysR family transcriptional regulator [Burkholderia sp.]
MELRQLRYFVAVAEELHFGRAAKRLFISQPALSFDIRKFEDALGVQLFSRTNKTVALTNAGEVLLGEARRLLLQAAEAERLTVRSASGLAGRLRIGFVHSMLYRGLPDAVRRFEADYPGVEVVLSEMNTQAQVQAIQRGQIDLGYAHWGHFPPEVESVPVYAEPFVCCLP